MGYDTGTQLCVDLAVSWKREMTGFYWNGFGEYKSLGLAVTVSASRLAVGYIVRYLDTHI